MPVLFYRKIENNKDKLAHFVSYFPFLTIITKFICNFARKLKLSLHKGEYEENNKKMR